MAVLDPSPTHPPIAPPTQVGAALRDARETLGVSIGEAAETTFIPRRYLEALERDAPIEEYPAPAFARHFLREYSAFLGLDDGPLLSRLGVPEPGSELPHGEPIEDEPAPAPWGRRVLSIVLAIAVLAGAGILADRAAHRPAPAALNLSSPQVPTAGLASPASPPPASPATQPAAAGIRIVLAATGRSYVSAVVDGKQKLNTFLLPGTTTRLHAKRRVQLVLGAPGVVRVTVNGTVVHPTATGVGTLTITWSHGRVHVA